MCANVWHHRQRIEDYCVKRIVKGCLVRPTPSRNSTLRRFRPVIRPIGVSEAEDEVGGASAIMTTGAWVLPRGRTGAKVLTTRRHQATGFPNGLIPFSRTVFGNWSVPHKMKEPKSLYQSPAGAKGPVLTHSWRANKSATEMRRSSTRWRRCCQTGRGRLAN